MMPCVAAMPVQVGSKKVSADLIAPKVVDVPRPSSVAVAVVS